MSLKFDIPAILQLSSFFVVSALLIVSVTDNDSLGDNVIGTYNIKSGIIKAESFGRSPSDILGTCAHEAGHYVWHEYLTEDDRAKYREIYNSSRTHVSFYAMIGGVDEDFAETFMEAIVCEFRPEFVPEDREPFFAGPVMDAWHYRDYMED